MTPTVPGHNPDEKSLLPQHTHQLVLGTTEKLDAFYLLACVILWRTTYDVAAGWELIRAMASPDPRIRELSICLLSRQSPALMPALCTAYLS